ncbi:MAG: hypothetical protein U0359_23565 [Byssovorax sp.]
MTVRTGALIFDDYIPSGTYGNQFVYTSDALCDALGFYDVIACEAVVDDVVVNASGSFMLYLQHSADGSHFLYSDGTTTPPAVPELKFGALSTTSTNVGISAYQGATYPLLGKVRFALQFGEPKTSGHVKLFVVQRDLA